MRELPAGLWRRQSSACGDTLSDTYSRIAITWVLLEKPPEREGPALRSPRSGEVSPSPGARPTLVQIPGKGSPNSACAQRRDVHKATCLWVGNSGNTN